jgi:hypothetical protein
MQQRRQLGLLIIATMFAVSFGSLLWLAIQSRLGHLKGFRVWVASGLAEIVVVALIVLIPRKNSD